MSDQPPMTHMVFEPPPMTEAELRRVIGECMEEAVRDCIREHGSVIGRVLEAAQALCVKLQSSIQISRDHDCSIDDEDVRDIVPLVCALDERLRQFNDVNASIPGAPATQPCDEANSGGGRTASPLPEVPLRIALDNSIDRVLRS